MQMTLKSCYLSLFVVVYSIIIGIQSKKLVAVQILFRHGDRALESKFLRYDKYKNYSWPAPLNELTPKGFAQQNRLGKRIYHRYGKNTKLIKRDCYNPKDIFIRSTIIKRALDSAKANLLGIFPGYNSSVVYGDNDLRVNNLSFIPIFTETTKKDSLLNARYECPKYKKLFEDRLNTSEFLRYNKSLEPLYSYLSENANEPIRDILKLKRYYLNVYTEKRYFNLSQPEWVDRSYLEVEKVINDTLNYIYGGASDLIGLPEDKELLKYESGELIESIISHFKRRSQGEKREKVVLLSAHDTNLFTISNLLGSKDKILNSKGLIDYAASIIFELWRDKYMNYFIKILSADNAYSHFRQVTAFVNGCKEKELCPLGDFEKANQVFFQNHTNRRCET